MAANIGTTRLVDIKEYKESTERHNYYHHYYVIIIVITTITIIICLLARFPHAWAD